MRLPSHNRLSLFVGLAIFASPALVRASEAPRLEIGAGVEGPTASDLERAIATQLGRDPFTERDAPRVVVRVTKSESALVAEVTVTPPGSIRTLEGDTCADVVRAAALSVALALESEAPSSPKPPREEPAAPPPRDESTNTPALSLGRNRAVLVASGVTSLGLLPRASAGLGANARVRVTDALWLSARGAWLPKTSMPNDAFAMSLFDAALGACFEPFATGGAAIDGCAHAFGGALAVASNRDPMKDDATKGFFGASLGAAARARIAGPLVVEGTAEAIFPFVHPTFVTTACPPTGFQQPFAALVLGAGLGASIP